MYPLVSTIFLIDLSLSDISKFLYNGEGLNKTAIGDYLGERHDFNQSVLDAFVALHDFTDLILVQALRYVAVVSDNMSCVETWVKDVR